MFSGCRLLMLFISVSRFCFLHRLDSWFSSLNCLIVVILGPLQLAIRCEPRFRVEGRSFDL